MSVVVITESPVARRLAERLVACHPVLRERQIEFRDTEGRHPTISKAHTILFERHMPVAILADADQDREGEEDADYDQRGLIESILFDVASFRAWRVLLFEPSMDVLLFRDEALRRAILPVEPTEKQLRRARRRPKRVLAELFAQAGEQDWVHALIQRLDQVDPSVLWTTSKKLKCLESFLLRRARVLPASSRPDVQENAPAV
jgi:hypothetical protein